MKLLYFDDFKLGVLKGDAVVDVSAEVKDIPHIGPGDLMNGLIERWDSYKPRLEAAVARGTGVPVTSSNHAMAWHCLRLAGIEDEAPEAGRLFELRVSA